MMFSATAHPGPQPIATHDLPIPRWEVEGAGIATPVADDTLVFFLSMRHEVMAVDRESGALRWRAPTGDAADAMSGANLRLAGEVVIAGDHGLVAFERATGDVAWRFTPAVGRGPGLFLGDVSAGVVVTGSLEGHVHAVQATTGRVIWSRQIVPTTDATVFAPRTKGDVVFASYVTFGERIQGGIVCLDLVTGRERWRRRMPAPANTDVPAAPSGPPALGPGVVMVAGRDGMVHAVDVGSGEDRWQVPRVKTHDRFADGFEQDIRAMVVAGPTLVVGSLTGVVVAYDLDTRRERWRVSPREASVGFVLGADARTVYVPFLSGELVALDARTGEVRWRIGGSSLGVVRPPLRQGNRLFMSGSVGGFVSFDTSYLADEGGRLGTGGP